MENSILNKFNLFIKNIDYAYLNGSVKILMVKTTIITQSGAIC